MIDAENREMDGPPVINSQHFSFSMDNQGVHVKTKRINRREALGAMSAAAGVALGFGGSNSAHSPSATSTPRTNTGSTHAARPPALGSRIPPPPRPATSTSGTTTGSTNAACAVTPTETIGPYPSLTSI